MGKVDNTVTSRYQHSKHRGLKAVISLSILGCQEGLGGSKGGSELFRFVESTRGNHIQACLVSEFLHLLCPNPYSYCQLALGPISHQCLLFSMGQVPMVGLAVTLKATRQR